MLLYVPDWKYRQTFQVERESECLQSESNQSHSEPRRLRGERTSGSRHQPSELHGTYRASFKGVVCLTFDHDVGQRVQQGVVGH